MAAPISRAKVNEASASYFTLTTYDADDAAVIASSIHYKVHDIASGNEVISLTAITPTSADTIVSIPADSNVILDDAHESEQRQITVYVNQGLPDQVVEVAVYTITNFRFVT